MQGKIIRQRCFTGDIVAGSWTTVGRDFDGTASESEERSFNAGAEVVRDAETELPATDLSSSRDKGQREGGALFELEAVFLERLE